MLLNKQLDHYFEIQETNKQNNEMKRSLKMAKGGLVKYDEGGTSGPILGSINPRTRQPYTRDELTTYYNTVKPVTSGINPFSSEGAILNSSASTNPALPKPKILGVNDMKVANNSTISPVIPTNSNYGNWGFNSAQETQDNQFVQNTPVIPIDSYQTPQTATTLQDPTSSNPTNSNSNNTRSFLEDNAGQIGQIATAGLTTALQARNLNKLARPKTLAKLRLSDKIANPNLVDYSAERGAIDRTALSQMDKASRTLSNSATAQAFRNQANLNRLAGTGKSFQEESNVNTQIKNQFLGQQNQAKLQEEMANNDIDKYNLENQYNYDAFKTGQKGQIIGTLGETAGQVFGNQTKYKNQLDQAEILSHSYDPTVYRDANGNVIKLPKGKNGGIIKRSLKFKK